VLPKDASGGSSVSLEMLTFTEELNLPIPPIEYSAGSVSVTLRQQRPTEGLMTQHTAVSNKAIGGLLAVAVAACSLTAVALGPAPAANATCASFFGLGNGNGCTSTFGSMAIAIGAGASASADGFFSTAMALGNSATASVAGALNLGVAAGTASHATAGSLVGGDFANIAITLGDHSDVFVGSMGGGTFGNIATNIANNGFAAATGVLNFASNVGGNGSTAEAESDRSTVGLNAAFVLFSNATTVEAFPGPLAIAGSIFQTGQTITKVGPGFNINGIRVGGATAPTKAATTVKATALGSSKKQTTGPAAAVKHTSKSHAS
jgi:hypothetical protein